MDLQTLRCKRVDRTPVKLVLDARIKGERIFMAKNAVTSPEHALQLLEKAVELKGADYVYTRPGETAAVIDNRSCGYVHGEECGCIIGCALTFNGWTVEELESFEGKNVWAIANANGFDEGARRVLWEAQGLQDGTDYDSTTQTWSRGESHSWGKALKAAKVKAEMIANESKEA